VVAEEPLAVVDDYLQAGTGRARHRPRRAV